MTPAVSLPPRQLPPLRRALGCQMAALIVTLSLIQPWIDRYAPNSANEYGALSMGLVAMLFAKILRLPTWWLIIQLGIPPLVMVTLSQSIPSWVFLLGFIALLGLSPRAPWGRVPLYLSRRCVADELAAFLPAHSRIVDIGCGPGGLIRRLSQIRTDLSCIGIEMAPVTYLWAKLRALTHPRCHIELGNFWRQDWSCYTVIYAYLSPAPMAEVWRKACQEMAEGSLIISNEFAIPGVDSIKTWSLPNGTLYAYRTTKSV
jgi:hypothetical protein